MALDQQSDWIQAFFNDEALVSATMLIRSYYQRVCCNRQFDDTHKNHVYNILLLTLNIKGNLSPNIMPEFSLKLETVFPTHSSSMIKLKQERTERWMTPASYAIGTFVIITTHSLYNEME